MNDSTERQPLPELLHGLVYTHNRANANTREIHQAAATLQALVELLVAQGVIDRQQLEVLQQTRAESLRRSYVDRGMAVAMQEFGISKYEFQGGAAIDCENRVHLCKAACCRLPFALSKEDVQEGIVRWELGNPYVNAREPDGYCTHLKRGTCHCTVYHHRPIPCRGYDCRQDPRIWLDFANKVVNPHLDDWDGSTDTTMTATPADQGGNKPV